MRKGWRVGVAASLCWAAAVGAAAAAEKVAFKDPEGDDNGPGAYTYPTDPVYRPGSFDLTGFELKARGDKVQLEVELAEKLEDVWHTGSGFSLQMAFVFVQTRPAKAEAASTKTGKETGKQKKKDKAKSKGEDKTRTGAAEGGKAAPEAGAAAAGTAAAGTAAAGSAKRGFTEGLPGLDIRFAAANGWDRCVILSPEPAARVRAAVEALAPAMKDAVIVPARVRGSGRRISATIDRKALGPGDPTDWGYQVVIASNDPYPAAGSLLVRKVAEHENQHRFGGGTDGPCGPNVLDVLAGGGKGEPVEADEQHRMLAYECKPDGSPSRPATLKMVRIEKPEED